MTIHWDLGWEYGFRGGVVGMSLVVAFVVVMAGCGFASFVAAAEEDIPVIEQIVTNITTIIAPGVSSEITAAGNLAIASLVIVCGKPAPGASKCDSTSLIGQYEAAVAADKPGILGKIEAALQAVSSQIQNIIGLAKGLAGTVGQTIVTAITVALGTITLLISIIPVAQAMLKGQAKVSVGTSPKAVPRAKTIKAQYNDVVIGGGYPQAVVN